MFLFIVVLLIGDLSGPPISVPVDLLSDYDLYKTRYGFVYKDHLYLTYLHTTAKIDMGGNLVAAYNKKGRGPGERLGGPIFRFGDELWCRDIMTQKMIILNMNLEFIREVPLKSLPPNPGHYDIAPGESSIYLLTMTELDGNRPNLIIQARDPKDFGLEKEFSLNDVPMNLSGPIPSINLRINYLGDNLFAIYRKAQLREAYDVHLWNSKDQSLKKLSHLTPQLLPAKALKQPTLIPAANGASSIAQVTRTANGFAVFFEAREINTGKDQRELNWFLFNHRFNQSLEPAKVNHRVVAFVLRSSGLTDAVLIRHPDLGVEVVDLN